MGRSSLHAHLYLSCTFHCGFCPALAPHPHLQISTCIQHNHVNPACPKLHFYISQIQHCISPLHLHISVSGSTVGQGAQSKILKIIFGFSFYLLLSCGVNFTEDKQHPGFSKTEEFPAFWALSANIRKVSGKPGQTVHLQFTSKYFSKPFTSLCSHCFNSDNHKHRDFDGSSSSLPASNLILPHTFFIFLIKQFFRDIHKSGQSHIKASTGSNCLKNNF